MLIWSPMLVLMLMMVTAKSMLFSTVLLITMTVLSLYVSCTALHPKGSQARSRARAQFMVIRDILKLCKNVSNVDRA